jgi:nucleoside-diphosphate-sugar epimerase
LIEVEHNVGTFVVISSSSVYRDALGKTLEEASQNGFPNLPVPIPETQPTVDPGPTTYSTRKIALEHTLFDDAATPVTILRPGPIHGPVPALQGNGGSLNASSTVARSYRSPIGAQAASIQPRLPTLPR